MRKTRMLMRVWNHSAKSNDKRAVTASLKHSLRLLDETNSYEKGDNLQCNAERSQQNLFIADGEIRTFAEVSPEEKQAFLESLQPISSAQNEREADKKVFRNYKAKLDKAISSEKKNGNVEAAAILSEIAEIPLHQEIEKEHFNHLVQRLNLEDVQMSRKNQRLNMIEKYIDAVQKVSSESIADKRKAYLQEGLFKFTRPPKDEKELHHITDEIEPARYYEHIKAFHEKYLPDYPVKNAIVHVDESISDEVQDNIHLHYYVSTQNQRTKKVDLLQEQIRVVNEYIKTQTDDADELIPTDYSDRKVSGLYKHESSRFMTYYQKMFYDFTNKELLNELDIEAVRSPEAASREKSLENLKRDAQSKLPKAVRDYNFASARKEHAEEKALEKEKNLENLDALEAEKLDRIARLDNEIARRDNTIAQRDNAIVERDNVLSEQDLEIEEKKSEVKILDDQKISLQEAVQNLSFQSSSLEEEITIKKGILSSLNESIRDLKFKVSQQFELIAKDLNSRVKALFHGHSAHADALFRGIMRNYVDIQNDVTRDACKATAKAFEDTQIVDAMKFDDKSRDRDDSDLTL